VVSLCLSTTQNGTIKYTPEEQVIVKKLKGKDIDTLIRFIIEDRRIKLSQEKENHELRMQVRDLTNVIRWKDRKHEAEKREARAKGVRRGMVIGGISFFGGAAGGIGLSEYLHSKN
jgi:hypothetical protein